MTPPEPSSAPDAGAPTSCPPDPSEPGRGAESTPPVRRAGRRLPSLLIPIPADRRGRRFTQLIFGLLLYGFTMGLMVRAVLGLDPWDVFHSGLTHLLAWWIDISYGTVITIVSVLVLLLWIPLRQRPGIGTLLNAAIIGWITDATLSVVPPIDNLSVRIGLLVLAVVGNAVAGGLYIGAGLGPGPRDGLMTGLVARGVGSVRLVRTCLELSVLGAGALLGGQIGVGTAVYAVAIGPLLQLVLPRFTIGSPSTTAVPRSADLGGSGRSRRRRRISGFGSW